MTDVRKVTGECEPH